MFIRMISAALVLACVGTIDADDDLKGVKCIVMGSKAVKEKFSADYEDGTVYFCCSDCKAAFETNNDKYAIKARHQLVLTGQYEQVACPLMGKDVVDGKSVKVGGAEIGLCCARCKSKVEGASSLEEKAKLVFSDKAWKKGFRKVESKVSLENIKCLVRGGKDAKHEFTSEFGGGNLYFCCGGCKKKFDGDPDAYSTKAHHQLVATGQFVQKACPFSGRDVDPDLNTEVGGVTVAFCCKGCRDKVHSESSLEKKAEMVFTAKAFEKGFESVVEDSISGDEDHTDSNKTENKDKPKSSGFSDR